MFCLNLLSDCMTTRMTSFKNILENDENTDDYSNSENFRPTILNTSLTLKNIERYKHKLKYTNVVYYIDAYIHHKKK
jgi:hypothetical protein